MGIAHAASWVGMSYNFWWQLEVVEAAEAVEVVVIDIVGRSSSDRKSGTRYGDSVKANLDSKLDEVIMVSFISGDLFLGTQYPRLVPRFN